MAAPNGSQITPENQAKWDEIQAMSIDDQATTFLKAFILDFSGNKFEEVLDIAQEFKKYLKDSMSKETDLEEHAAHLFLERRGETLTAAALREILKQIDVDNNHRVAFIEYALFTWKKTVAQFFKELATPKAGSSAELEKAIAAYRAILKVREDRNDKIKELEKIAELGGVKGMAAKNTLAQMHSEDALAQNRAEITAGAKKRAAEKNTSDPFEEEKKRLEAEKAEREAAEKAKREESRAKLAARAGAFGEVAKK